MVISLDHEMAELVTALKMTDWTTLFIFAVQHDDDKVHYVRIIQETEVEIMQAQPSMRIDYWSIADLVAELLVSVASGFSMNRLNENHSYVCTLLEVIRKYNEDQSNIVWTAFDMAV